MQCTVQSRNDPTPLAGKLIGAAGHAICAAAFMVFAAAASAQWSAGDEGAGDELAPSKPEDQWNELLVRHSATDSCGLRDWHVRQGYQILRREYADRWPLSFENLQFVRAEAVEAAESALLGRGHDNFIWYCSTQGEASARFFVDAWAKSQTAKVEQTRFGFQLGQKPTTSNWTIR